MKSTILPLLLLLLISSSCGRKGKNEADARPTLEFAQVFSRSHCPEFEVEVVKSNLLIRNIAGLGHTLEAQENIEGSVLIHCFDENREEKYSATSLSLSLFLKLQPIFTHRH